MDFTAVCALTRIICCFAVVYIFFRIVQYLKSVEASGQQDVNRPITHGKRQKNALREWRFSRQPSDDEDRVPILEHAAPFPESETHGQNPHCHPTSQVINPQFIINVNPPSQMPFHPPHGTLPARQPHRQQQVLLSFPAPPQPVNVPADASHPTQQQQQLGGFAQLYAQAQPDMNVFPLPPPPYETQPLPSLPSRQK